MLPLYRHKGQFVTEAKLSDGLAAIPAMSTSGHHRELSMLFTIVSLFI